MEYARGDGREDVEEGIRSVRFKDTSYDRTPLKRKTPSIEQSGAFSDDGSRSDRSMTSSSSATPKPNVLYQSHSLPYPSQKFKNKLNHLLYIRRNIMASLDQLSNERQGIFGDQNGTVVPKSKALDYLQMKGIGLVGNQNSTLEHQSNAQDHLQKNGMKAIELKRICQSQRSNSFAKRHNLDDKSISSSQSSSKSSYIRDDQNAEDSLYNTEFGKDNDINYSKDWEVPNSPSGSYYRATLDNLLYPESLQNSQTDSFPHHNFCQTNQSESSINAHSHQNNLSNQYSNRSYLRSNNTSTYKELYHNKETPYGAYNSLVRSYLQQPDDSNNYNPPERDDFLERSWPRRRLSNIARKTNRVNTGANDVDNEYYESRTLPILLNNHASTTTTTTNSSFRDVQNNKRFTDHSSASQLKSTLRVNWGNDLETPATTNSKLSLYSTQDQAFDNEFQNTHNSRTSFYTGQDKEYYTNEFNTSIDSNYNFTPIRTESTLRRQPSFQKELNRVSSHTASISKRSDTCESFDETASSMFSSEADSEFQFYPCVPESTPYSCTSLLPALTPAVQYVSDINESGDLNGQPSRTVNQGQGRYLDNHNYNDVTGYNFNYDDDDVDDLSDDVFVDDHQGDLDEEEDMRKWHLYLNHYHHSNDLDSYAKAESPDYVNIETIIQSKPRLEEIKPDSCYYVCTEEHYHQPQRINNHSLRKQEPSYNVDQHHQAQTNYYSHEQQDERRGYLHPDQNNQENISRYLHLQQNQYSAFQEGDMLQLDINAAIDNSYRHGHIAADSNDKFHIENESNSSERRTLISKNTNTNKNIGDFDSPPPSLERRHNHQNRSSTNKNDDFDPSTPSSERNGLTPHNISNAVKSNVDYDSPTSCELSNLNLNLANAIDSLRRNSTQSKSRRLWKERRARMKNSPSKQRRPLTPRFIDDDDDDDEDDDNNGGFYNDRVRDSNPSRSRDTKPRVFTFEDLNGYPSSSTFKNFTSSEDRNGVPFPTSATTLKSLRNHGEQFSSSVTPLKPIRNYGVSLLSSTTPMKPLRSILKNKSNLLSDPEICSEIPDSEYEYDSCYIPIANKQNIIDHTMTTYDNGYLNLASRSKNDDDLNFQSDDTLTGEDNMTHDCSIPVYNTTTHNDNEYKQKSFVSIGIQCDLLYVDLEYNKQFHSYNYNTDMNYLKDKQREVEINDNNIETIPPASFNKDQSKILVGNSKESESYTSLNDSSYSKYGFINEIGIEPIAHGNVINDAVSLTSNHPNDSTEVSINSDPDLPENKNDAPRYYPNKMAKDKTTENQFSKYNDRDNTMSLASDRANIEEVISNGSDYSKEKEVTHLDYLNSSSKDSTCSNVISKRYQSSSHKDETLHTSELIIGHAEENDEKTQQKVIIANESDDSNIMMFSKTKEVKTLESKHEYKRNMTPSNRPTSGLKDNNSSAHHDGSSYPHRYTSPCRTTPSLKRNLRVMRRSNLRKDERYVFPDPEHLSGNSEHESGESEPQSANSVSSNEEIMKPLSSSSASKTKDGHPGNIQTLHNDKTVSILQSGIDIDITGNPANGSITDEDSIKSSASKLKGNGIDLPQTSGFVLVQDGIDTTSPITNKHTSGDILPPYNEQDTNENSREIYSPAPSTKDKRNLLDNNECTSVSSPQHTPNEVLFPNRCHINSSPPSIKKQPNNMLSNKEYESTLIPSHTPNVDILQTKNDIKFNSTSASSSSIKNQPKMLDNKEGKSSISPPHTPNEVLLSKDDHEFHYLLSPTENGTTETIAVRKNSVEVYKWTRSCQRRVKSQNRKSVNRAKTTMRSRKVTKSEGDGSDVEQKLTDV